MTPIKLDSTVTNIAENEKHHCIIRLPKVMEITGMRRSSIYSAMKNGTFPTSISLGARCVGWSKLEIEHWIFKRMEARLR